MSFKFEHKGKQYWAKETAKATQVHYLLVKGCADIVLTLDGRYSVKELCNMLDRLGSNSSA